MKMEEWWRAHATMTDIRDEDLLLCLIARCVIRAVDLAKEGADFLATFNRGVLSLIRKLLEKEAELFWAVVKVGEECGFKVSVRRVRLWGRRS